MASAPRDWFQSLHDFIYLKEEEGSDEEARLILDSLELREGDCVLDAPCATGRIGVRLARAGCRVTEVDINHSYLQRARERFRSEGLEGNFLQMDLRRLCFREGFDAVCNWWASFGYFSDEENLQALRGMVAALRPGGRLILEQPNRQFVLRHYRRLVADGPWICLSQYDAQRQRMECLWVLSEKGREQQYPMSLRWYTLSQLRGLFRKVGLSLEATYGDYDGCAYGPGTRRLIVVGRKG